MAADLNKKKVSDLEQMLAEKSETKLAEGGVEGSRAAVEAEESEEVKKVKLTKANMIEQIVAPNSKCEKDEEAELVRKWEAAKESLLNHVSSTGSDDIPADKAHSVDTALAEMEAGVVTLGGYTHVGDECSANRASS
eukprot:8704953-Pyramimonas_sp.AAC.1